MAKNRAAKRRPSGPQPTNEDLQCKITLTDSEPTIWRRMQVMDCTLDALHERIPGAMGWDNAHAYRFRFGKGRDVHYCVDAARMGGSFDEEEDRDSTTLLSQILPTGRKGLRFAYVYDFGDDREHEVAYERRLAVDPAVKYPVRSEGECACPPEDVGGVWGCADLLEALESGAEAERQGHLLEWLGKDFDPKKFDPAAAAEAMRP